MDLYLHLHSADSVEIRPEAILIRTDEVSDAVLEDIRTAMLMDPHVLKVTINHLHGMLLTSDANLRHAVTAWQSLRTRCQLNHTGSPRWGLYGLASLCTASTRRKPTSSHCTTRYAAHTGHPPPHETVYSPAGGSSRTLALRVS